MVVTESNFVVKVISFLIVLVIRIVYFFDLLLGTRFRKSYFKLLRIFIFVCSFGFITFLGYSGYSGLLKQIFEGYFSASVNPSLQTKTTTQFISDLGKVLGPVMSKEITLPTPSAEIFLVVDVNSGKILAEKNEELRKSPASTTKLMTAIVAHTIYDLDLVLKVPVDCTQLDTTNAGFPPGSQVAVKDLMKAMLIESAGDAACTLASQKVETRIFVELMNINAKNYGMTNTLFTNPVGFDFYGGQNYSTAWDLYLLAREFKKFPDLSEYVGISIQTTKYSYQNRSIELTLKNTNKMLSEVTGSVGIKTGTTDEAGEVLIYEFKSPENPKIDLIIIVMGSKNRFEDTKELLNWTLSSYTWY